MEVCSACDGIVLFLDSKGFIALRMYVGQFMSILTLLNIQD